MKEKLQPTEADRKAADEWLDKAWDRPVATYFEEAFLAGILHERERAAGAAEKLDKPETDWVAAQLIRAEACRDIAAAIRKGTP